MKNFFIKIETILKIFVLILLAFFAAFTISLVTDSFFAGFIFFTIFVVFIFYYYLNFKEKNIEDIKQEDIDYLKDYNELLDATKMSQREKDKEMKKKAKSRGIKL